MLPKFTLAPELLSSLVITLILAVLFIVAGKKLKQTDPLARPKGIVLVAETGIKMVYDYMKGLMPHKFEKNYYPYFSMLFAYLLVANLWGLLGFEAPTSNLSITFAFGFITFILIQINTIKHNGVLPYIKDKIWPPTNLISMVSPLLSLSIRIFANILSGSFILALLYSATAGLVKSLVHIPFNFLGPIVAPVLHLYFDVFSGVIQALVFVTLSSILIAIDNPDEE